jgi:hypothetical protein
MRLTRAAAALSAGVALFDALQAQGRVGASYTLVVHCASADPAVPLLPPLEGAGRTAGLAWQHGGCTHGPDVCALAPTQATSPSRCARRACRPPPTCACATPARAASSTCRRAASADPAPWAPPAPQATRSWHCRTGGARARAMRMCTGHARADARASRRAAVRLTPSHSRCAATPQALAQPVGAALLVPYAERVPAGRGHRRPRLPDRVRQQRSGVPGAFACHWLMTPLPRRAAIWAPSAASAARATTHGVRARGRLAPCETRSTVLMTCVRWSRMRAGHECKKCTNDFRWVMPVAGTIGAVLFFAGAQRSCHPGAIRMPPAYRLCATPALFLQRSSCCPSGRRTPSPPCASRSP